MTKEKLWKTQIKKLEKKLLGEKNVKITPPHLIANQTKLKKTRLRKNTYNLRSKTKKNKKPKLNLTLTRFKSLKKNWKHYLDKRLKNKNSIIIFKKDELFTFIQIHCCSNKIFRNSKKIFILK